MRRNLCLCLAWLPLWGACGPAHADFEVLGPFKLTLTDYRYSGSYTGQDANLRWRRDGTDVWVGAYHDPVFGNQVRTGADTSVSLGGSASLQPSVQLASGGFIGGSLNAQIGDPFFVMLGWGRTDLRTYFNLNFDPNDAVTASVGWQGPDERTVSFTLVADDRLHTGQRDWHAYVRWPLNDGLRLTVDVLRKSGLGDGGPVSGWGLSATLDFPRWFVRLARDPKQNFSVEDVTRLSGGVRY